MSLFDLPLEIFQKILDFIVIQLTHKYARSSMGRPLRREVCQVVIVGNLQVTQTEMPVIKDRSRELRRAWLETQDQHHTSPVIAT